MSGLSEGTTRAASTSRDAICGRPTFAGDECAAPFKMPLGRGKRSHPATESFAASKWPGAHFREEECNLVAFFLTPTAGSAGLPLGNRQRRTSCSVGGRFELR